MAPLRTLSSSASVAKTEASSSISSMASATSASSSSSSFYEQHCYFLLPMIGWFIFSAALSSYNKVVFGGQDGGLRFPCPLLMTSLHFCAQWVFSETLCALWPATFGSDRISQMGWKEYLEVSIPCGLVTSADIGLSNLSWVTLSLTFYTMIKSSTPIFVLFWAYLFGIARITPQLVSVVVLITVGEYIVVGGQLEENEQDEDSDDFPWSGIVLCLSAAVLSGARWTLVQLKIQSLQPPLKTTIATMRLLAPSMFCSLFLVSLCLERPWYRLEVDFVNAVEIMGLGLFGAIFAICMILCEFFLILKANAIVLSVGGVVKEVVTIWVGILFFGDSFTLQSFLGCCVIFAGVIMYKFTFKKKERSSRAQPQQPTNKNKKLLNPNKGGSASPSGSRGGEEQQGLLLNPSHKEHTSETDLLRHDVVDEDRLNAAAQRNTGNSSPPLSRASSGDDSWVMTDHNTDDTEDGIELRETTATNSGDEGDDGAVEIRIV